MEDGGTLSIGCYREKDNVVITVADTGPGIDLDDLQQVFDPYFTTKPSGTGLGLAIVHKIVEAHDGRLEVDSEPGKGTIFQVYFPMLSSKAVAADLGLPVTIPTGTEQILIVDDEEPIR